VEISFADKVAFVTGAGAGIGRATARAFAEYGAAVAVVDRDFEAAATLANSLVRQGHRAAAFACDVADESQVADTVQATIATFGHIDVAYNNAGIQTPNVETADADGEDFDRVNAVNLRGLWNCMKHELRHMHTRGSGSIVNCSSIGGLIGIGGLAAYHASKHGVIGLTKSAALEYAARGIRINAICPGVVDTLMVARMLDSDPESMAEFLRDQPIGRLGEPEEIANAVLFLCSPAASFIIGAALAIDGGYTAR
jgi:NAD(P)-dependent dehydrogenase (short-subunit alcohol dehydrogenase family)